MILWIKNCCHAEASWSEWVGRMSFSNIISVVIMGNNEHLIFVIETPYYMVIVYGQLAHQIYSLVIPSSVDI